MHDSTNVTQNAVPLSVVAEEATGQLLIEWSDGHTTRHSIEWLRWQCPCAMCKGEMGEPGRLASVTQLRPDETRLEDVQPIGRYGLMPFWGDGHHDGIFTYAFLRNNCQCEECTKQRDA
jgi:DUF971 family protein